MIDLIADPGGAGRRVPVRLDPGDPGGSAGGDGPAGASGGAGQGGAALERLARVDTLAFDKTGTLTEGRPELGDCVPIGGFSSEELLRLAASAERPSEHPLARLIVAEAKKAGICAPRGR